jgi:hypothetical protein
MDVHRINEILDESISSAVTADTVLVDTWIPLNVRRDKVRQHAAELKDQLRQWPGSSVHVIFTKPEELRRISPETFRRELDDFRTFALLAFGQVAGWWTLIKPAALEADAGYEPRTLHEQMKKLGLLEVGSELIK